MHRYVISLSGGCTHLRLQIFPVIQCSSTSRGPSCAFLCKFALGALKNRVAGHRGLVSNMFSCHCFICTESSFHTAFSQWQNAGGEDCNSKGNALLLYFTCFFFGCNICFLVGILVNSHC